MFYSKGKIIISLIIFITISVFAQGFSINPKTKMEYEKRLKEINILERQMTKSLKCIKRYQEEVAVKSNPLEIKLGKLRKDEDIYLSNMLTDENEYKEYSKIRIKAQDRYEELMHRLQKYEIEKYRQERDLHDCKSKGWTLDFFCDSANELGKSLNLIEDVDSRLKAYSIKANGATKRYKESLINFTKSQKKLVKVRKELELVKIETTELERTIGTLKKYRSILTTKIQVLSKIIDGFKEITDSIQNINTEDQKRRTLKKIERTISKMDDLLITAPIILIEVKKIIFKNKSNCIN